MTGSMILQSPNAWLVVSHIGLAAESFSYVFVASRKNRQQLISHVLNP